MVHGAWRYMLQRGMAVVPPYWQQKQQQQQQTVQQAHQSGLPGTHPIARDVPIAMKGLQSEHEALRQRWLDQVAR